MLPSLPGRPRLLFACRSAGCMVQPYKVYSHQTIENISMISIQRSKKMPIWTIARWIKYLLKQWENEYRQPLLSSSVSIPIRKGVKQGDIISPKLFITYLEMVISNVNRKDGIHINNKQEMHHWFADGWFEDHQNHGLIADNAGKGGHPKLSSWL